MSQEILWGSVVSVSFQEKLKLFFSTCECSALLRVYSQCGEV